MREHTGQSIGERIREVGRAAEERRRKTRKEPEFGRERGGFEEGGGHMSKMMPAVPGKAVGDAERGAGNPVGPTTAAVLQVGREREDWKARRDAREREALEDGSGYGGLIRDQIWEVWNAGWRSKSEGSGEVVEGKKGGK